MSHIKLEFINLAKKKSEKLVQQLKMLNKFQVVGTMNTQEFNRCVAFLTHIGAKFNTNGKYLIWLEVLPKSLKTLFLNNKN